jgi:hypothetical protein
MLASQNNSGLPMFLFTALLASPIVCCYDAVVVVMMVMIIVCFLRQDLAMETKLNLISRSSCLSLPRGQITSIHITSSFPVIIFSL